MSLEEKVAQVKANIAAAAREVGRDPSEITLVAATKVQTSDTIRQAIAAGITICGENRVQEMTAHLADHAYAGAALHFIGHLQTNKVKDVVGRVDPLESVDSEHLLLAVEKQAAKLGVRQDILLEVNIGREENKSGVLPEALPELLEQVAVLPALHIRGLMAIPPADAAKSETIRFFSRMTQYFIDIKNKSMDNVNMDYLSMGMSADYEDAIRAGANMVRVGSALYGARVYR